MGGAGSVGPVPMLVDHDHIVVHSVVLAVIDRIVGGTVVGRHRQQLRTVCCREVRLGQDVVRGAVGHDDGAQQDHPIAVPGLLEVMGREHDQPTTVPLLVDDLEVRRPWRPGCVSSAVPSRW